MPVGSSILSSNPLGVGSSGPSWASPKPRWLQPYRLPSILLKAILFLLRPLPFLLHPCLAGFQLLY
uniref:Uncharacterized protein n=1 Tax=Salix viminalis TaxID=40686 RepID=A0A6N2K5G9_SALVM